ncbi:MAG: hypothetical protein AAB176_12775 [Pseudomonadota bacterium]|jgi:hypothetical protein
MRIFRFSGLVVTAWATMACGHVVPGAGRDAHGCIPSAGYVWSTLHARCLRPFEAELAFVPYGNTSQPVLRAYIVLNASDSPERKAELYLPGHLPAIPMIVMDAVEGELRPVLMENKAQGIEVIKAKDDLFIRVKGQLLFVRSAG